MVKDVAGAWALGRITVEELADEVTGDRVSDTRGLSLSVGLVPLWMEMIGGGINGVGNDVSRRRWR